MVSCPTVLVLGAGASHCYEFPLGPMLRRVICEDLLREHSDPRQCLYGLGFDAALIDDFVERLRATLFLSIDAFLAHFSQFREVGKAAIAASLVRFEDRNFLFVPQVQDDRNWYPCFLRRIGASASGIPLQPLTIVTFNYDRSLEEAAWSFVRAYSPRDGQTQESMAAKLAPLRIIHVHGSLGPHIGWSKDSVSYTPTVTVPRVDAGRKAIQVLGECDDSSPEFQEARRAIDSAKRVVFMGFGVHPENVARLGLGPGSTPTMSRAERQILVQCPTGEMQRMWRDVHSKAFHADLGVTPVNTQCMECLDHVVQG